MHRRFLVVVSTLAVVAAVLAGGLPPAAAADDLPVVRYTPPVQAPIVDRFDLPARPWMPGNRGIDYGTEAGAAVTAAADGEVVFAGDVAGALHVTVRHADGLRTSYSFLASLLVAAGQRVQAGQPVGTARGPVHFGVRAPDDTYLDPEALLAGTLEPRVRLVPGAEDGLDPLRERRAVLDTILGGGAAAVSFVAERAVAAGEIALRVATELDPVTHARRFGLAAYDWVRLALDCTPADEDPPAPEGRRILVLVSGLGTTDDANSTHDIDAAGLGYAPEDVVSFSYQGGQAPRPGRPPQTETPTSANDGRIELLADPSLSDIPVHSFSALDSQQSLDVSASRLADLIEQVHAAEPDVPIDVVGHSQGGVVARLGTLVADAEGRLPDTVENVVSVSSPHQGAPLATGVEGLQASDTGNDGLEQLRDADLGPIEDLDDRAPAIGQLSETSALLGAMRATPMPDGVRFSTITGSGDLVVPAVSGVDARAARNVRLLTGPSIDAHGDITKDQRLTRELALTVAGAPATCQGALEAALAVVESDVIHTSETLLGSGLAGGAIVADGVRAPVEAIGG